MNRDGELRSIRHDEFNICGRTVIVSTADIFGKLETMILYQDSGEEINSVHPETEAEAMAAHERFIERYIRGKELVNGVKLTGKYERLYEDFLKAVEACRPFEGGPDGGTSNADKLILRLPRYDGFLVRVAAQKAGLTVTDGRYLRAKVWSVFSPFGGQGEHNTNQVGTMYKVLKALGYDVSMYYRID